MLQTVLEQLITFRTVSHDHAEQERAMQWIVSVLEGLPVHVTHHSVNGFPSLIITTRPTKRPKIFLVAHLDVVDAPDALFLSSVRDGTLFGRGAADMKFAIASFLQLLRDLGADGPLYDIGVMITTDEEVGSANGVPALLNMGYGADFAVIPDSGVNWEIEAEGKGGLDFLIEAKGASGHASRPWEGDNAIEHLLRFLQDLRSQFPERYAREDGYDQVTINIGNISGGGSSNRIPDAAHAVIDMRFPPHMKKKDVARPVQSTLVRHPSVTATETLYVEAYHVDTDNHFVKLFSDIAEKHRGAQPTMARAFGSCDARFFTPRGIPALVIRPKAGGHHTSEEWIDLKDLSLFHTVLSEFVRISTRISA